MCRQELMSEDDDRCYDEEQDEDAETEPINNLRHELPVIAYLFLLVLVVHFRFHFLQRVLFQFNQQYNCKRNSTNDVFSTDSAVFWW